MLSSPRTDMVRRKERFALSDLGTFQRAGINPAYARVQLVKDAAGLNISG